MEFPNNIPQEELYKVIEKKAKLTKLEQKFLEKEKYYKELIETLKKQLKEKEKEDPVVEDEPLFAKPTEKILLPDGKVGDEYRE